jgi:hypothetical protein
MKVLNYLIVFLLMLFFSSCSEDNPTFQIGPRGVVENDVFTDDRHGLKLTIPEGWEVDDTSQYDMNTILRLNHDENNTFTFTSEPLLPAQHFEDYFEERYKLIKSRSGLFSLFGARNMSGLGKYTIDINDVGFHSIYFQYKKKEVKEKLENIRYYLQTGRDVISMKTKGTPKIISKLGSYFEKVDFASLPPADDSQVTIDRAYYQEGIKSTDSDGYYNLHEYGIKLPIPKNYSIRRNLYADGWSTRMEKDEQNHIVVTERLIDKGLSYDVSIEKNIKKMSTSFGEKIIQLKSKKINGKKYDYFNVNMAIVAGLTMEAFKEEFIKENSKEKYDKEYEETIRAKKDAGIVVFMRELNNGEFLNIELTYADEESRGELMEKIEEMRPLEIKSLWRTRRKIALESSKKHNFFELFY